MQPPEREEEDSKSRPQDEQANDESDDIRETSYDDRDERGKEHAEGGECHSAERPKTQYRVDESGLGAKTARLSR